MTGLLAVILAIGAVAFLALRGGGPTVIGPDRSRVGHEVAFAVLDDEVTVEEWRVGDIRTTDQILLLTPGSTGTVTIELITDDGNSTIELDVIEAETDLSIAGPATLPVAATTTVSAQTADDVELLWTIGDESYLQTTLDLVPAEPGIITVELQTDDGRQTERTFTVIGDDSP